MINETTKSVSLMTIHEAAKTGIMPENTLGVCAGTMKSLVCTSVKGRSSILMCLLPFSMTPTTI